MIILELYKYFSTFIPTDVLEKTFVREDADPSYSLIKNEVMTAESDWRMDEISDFIFGIDETAVTRRISSVKGLFLFVEYSRLESQIDPKTDGKTDAFHVGVTVARPTRTDSDQLSEAIAQDSAFQVLSRIRTSIRDEFDAVTRTKWLEFPTQIQPFNAPQLAHSMGWTMEFDVVGAEIL